MTDTPMVAARDLERTYGSHAGAVHALRGVSFDVAPGELARAQLPP